MLLVLGCAAHAEPQQPAAAGAAGTAGGRGAAVRVNSPEVLPDHRVTFRLRAPNAAAVLVNGDWPGGRGLRMTKDAAGVWSVTTEPLSPEIWSYTFSVDGVTMLDPGNYHAMRDGARYLSPVLIPGEGSALYQTHAVPHGAVSAVWYPSPVLKAERRLLVYTPPGYEGTTARYPTMYLFHGGSADEEAWNLLGVFNVIMDNLIAQGKAKPMIVVLPNAYWNEAAVLDVGAARSVASAPAGGGGQSYEQAEEDIVKGIVPFVEKRFRALTGREDRAIAGLSMGGGIAINVGLKRLDVFASVGQFSSGMFGGVGGYAAYDIDKISPGFLKDSGATNRKLKLLYFSCGAEDPRMPFQAKAADDLRAHGVKLTFRSFPGAHEWRVWRSSLADFAPLLFR
ncbi:MAG: esterase [Acidobacteria bacterium]|nr:esterase [Acidobacteriota bacterium]